jgi:hypothetical protein
LPIRKLGVGQVLSLNLDVANTAPLELQSELSSCLLRLVAAFNKNSLQGRFIQLK